MVLPILKSGVSLAYLSRAVRSNVPSSSYPLMHAPFVLPQVSSLHPFPALGAGYPLLWVRSLSGHPAALRLAGSSFGAPSPSTPLNGYTFTLFRRHPRRHGRSSIRLQTIHMHYCERLVPFPAHDDSSSIQHFGDECRAEPTATAASFPAFVPALCRESIPALPLGTLASGPYRRSHVFGATPPVATPHERAGTPPAILPGVRPHTRSPCLPPLPVPGVFHT